MSKAKTNPSGTAPSAESVSVTVLSRVNHDGVVYAEGEVLEGLTASQAQSLVDAGAAELTSA